MFKHWHEERPAKQKESVEVDCKLWKLRKFVKEESDVENCKAVIMEHQEKLKEVFINLISASSYPAITMMAISNWVTRCQIIEGPLNNTVVDRLFISANFQQPDSPKFQTIGNALVRFEFYELLVRIANAKYRE